MRGFTLIELLIVIAIIAVIAAVVFVTLDPLTRFRDARDASRWADVSAVLSAIKIDQVDNGGGYSSAVAGTTAGEVYLIGTCASGATATGVTNNCTTDPTQNVCLDLTSGSDDLVTEGYLGTIPVSPNGDGSWTSSLTGYTFQRAASGIVTVRACDTESLSEIIVAR